MRHQHRSFRARITLVFGVLVVLVVGVLSLGLGKLLERQTLDAQGAALDALTNNISNTFAQGLQDRLREVRVLADSPELWREGMASEQVRQALDRSRAITPSNAWVGVADIDGKVQSASDGMLVGQSVSERPWFVNGLVRPFVGDIHPAKLLESLMHPDGGSEPLRFVDFAAPLRVGGKIVGVVGLHGSWVWARSVIEPLIGGKHGGSSNCSVFVFDRHGALLYAPDKYYEAMDRAGQMLAPSVPGQSPQILTWSDGQKYLTSVKQLPALSPEADLGWQVVARESAEVASAPTRLLMRTILWIGGLVAIVAALASWIAANSLASPLASMAAAAHAVESEVPGANIPINHDNIELFQLSSALSSMTRQLMSSKEALEQKVEERTAELARLNEVLTLQALRDPLTGLSNRRAFDEQLIRSLAHAQRQSTALSMLMLDIDHFKSINDRFGHPAGDGVLRALAGVLQSKFRTTDVIARIGGEEFAVLLSGASPKDAENLAKEILNEIAAMVMPVVGRITASIGVAQFRPHEDDTGTLLERADEALYEAKRGGRNRVVVAEVSTVSGLLAS